MKPRFRRAGDVPRWSLAAGVAAALLGCGGEASRIEDLVSVEAASRDRARVAAVLAPEPRTNILLITIDTCRADRLGCYGNPHIATPNIDALAARGVAFADAVCPVPITLPSHCSIMTGLNPTTHRVRDNGRFTLDAEAVTLAELFAREGYTTGAFVGSFPVAAQFGLAQGFGVYSDELPRFRVAGHGLMRERSASEVNEPALDWIAGLGDEPFFAWVHYFDPHWPYEPPGAFAKRYASALYDGEIAFVDAQVGRLLDALDERGLSENTIVVVTADHGEGLGEHKEFSHSVLLYDATMRVPFVIGPASRARVAGSGAVAAADLIVTSQVRSIDVAPTILSIAAIDLPAVLDGIALRDDTGAPIPASAALCYMETFAPWYGFLWSPLRAVRTSEWKYIEGPRKELFDRVADPLELSNRLAVDARQGRPWQAALDAIAIETAPSVESEMDAQTAEQLRALGYIGMGRAIEQPRPETGDNPNLPDPSELIEIYFTSLAPAMDRFTRGDYPAAVMLCDRALARDSTNIQGWTVRAHAQTRMGRYDEARASYRRVLELDPENVGAHFSMGAIAYRTGDKATAEQAYRAVIAIDPGVVEAAHDLAIVLMEQSRHDEAEALLRGIVASDSTFVSAYRTLGNLYVTLGRRGEALEAYVSGLIAAPGDRDVERAVLSLAAEDHLGPAALARLERAWEAGARSGGHAVALVEVAYTRGRKDLARATLNEALATAPSAELYRVRAWLHKQEGRPALARADLETAARLEPENAQARANLAAYFRSEGDLDAARREYDACLALDPRNEAALVGLGIIYAEWRQLGRAMELWERALQVNPESPARENLATARGMITSGGSGS